MADTAPFEHWRPLLYVIPTNPVTSKIKTVPISQRAGFGSEYIIEDLSRNEFDIVELI